MTKRPILFLYVFLLAWTFPSGAQVINGFSPQRAVLGSSFTLTIRGAGFSFPETVQFSPDTGITVVSTTVLSSNQITAQVHVAPQAAKISYSIKVLFAARAVTAPGTFQVTDIFGSGLPPPILNSIGPSLVSQGSQNVRLILNGRNFRPGATVVISPPLSSTKASTARAQATDVAVQSVVQLNDTLLLAQITVSQRAVVGARAVDVVNADGTSSGPTLTNALGQIPGSLTSQPFNIATSNSLAAPLNVATIAISYPRNGTVITQGDDIYGGAVLAGTGTGVITGVWLWDGNPFEQFAVSMTGGASVRLKTSRSLPSIHIGQHTLTVHVTSPNQLQTRDVDVVVNPGNWKLEKLLAPPPDAGFSSNSSPLLQWALIPAADHYQVGLATEPFYNSVDHWYDVNATEWRVPQKIWQALPEKQLYWTVRVVDISGDTRKPAPMRAIWRLPEMPALQPLVETREGAGIFLTWQALQDNLVYRVAISRNQDGTDLVRRFLTRDPKIYVRADRLALRSGQIYFWTVRAFSSGGHSIVSSPVQTFVAPGPSPISKRKKPRPYEIATAGAMPGPPELGGQIAARFPAAQATVHDSLPTIKIGFKTKINPADVALVLDEVDVTAMAQITDTTVVLPPVGPLENGGHQVTVSVGSDSDSWKFTVDQEKEVVGTGLSTPKSDAEVSPPASESSLSEKPAPTAEGQGAASGPGKEGTDTKSSRLFLLDSSGQLASNTQWISGSTPDTNASSVANREIIHIGPWTTEVNGSGLLNSTAGPDPRHALGRFNDYVLRMAYERQRWNGNLRFGVLASSLYTGSEFVTPASAREAIETSLATLAGKFFFFANTDDNLLGGGSGAAIHQQIRGAGYEAPLPSKVGSLRFMWLTARDIGEATTISFTPTLAPTSGPPLPGPPTSTPLTPAFLPNLSAGDVYGALLGLHLGAAWMWTSEYSLSYDNPSLLLGSGRLFGRAWRSAVAGSWRAATMSFAFRDVSGNFGSPANLSLSPNGNPDRRGFDASISRPFPVGTFTVTYQLSQSGVHSSTAPTLSMNNLTLGWSRSLNRTTVLQIGAREARITTGTLPPAVLSLTPAQELALRADSRDAGLNASISQHVGTITLTLNGTRDWSRNRLFTTQDVITSGVNLGANWQGTSFFQFNSNVSINWIAAEKFTVGSSRVVTTYLQPMLVWKRTGLSLAPLVSISNNNAELGTGAVITNSFTSQYVGRLSWQTPKKFKFSTLTCEGGQTHFRDAVLNSTRTDKRFLVLWNIVWGYNHSGSASPK